MEERVRWNVFRHPDDALLAEEASEELVDKTQRSGYFVARQERYNV
jgi:hypothetical protein